MEEDDKKLQLLKAETGTGNTVAVSASFILSHRNDISRGKIPFYKVIKLVDGKLGVEKVDFTFLENLATEFLDKRQFVIPKDWESRLGPKPDSDPFEKQLGLYSAMAPEERVREVAQIRHALEDLKKADAPPELRAKAIMDAIQNTFVINKASLKLQKAAIGVNERSIASETQTVVSSALTLLEESETALKLLDCFKSLSNGQTVNHISRVFSTMAAYMYYYNRAHQRRVAQEVRLVFEKEYLELYRYIMGPIQDHLFVADNLVQLPSFSPPDMKRYALGAFLHDIGKMANLDYFESDLAFDAQQIRQHVFVSVQLIIMNYGTEHEDARLMAGDHHNALFHKDGYGLTRLERERGLRQPMDFERCISANADDFMLGKAKGYLPTEMLAICDIYDAMTDASRTYKKAMSPAEAIVFMFDKPLCSGRIDPVLFSIFVDYLADAGVEVPVEYGLVFKVKNRK